MAKTADTIAIYSRKSRYTGKGESIGNQIDLCREYIRTHYGDAAAEHAVAAFHAALPCHQHRRNLFAVFEPAMIFTFFPLHNSNNSFNKGIL